jgi:hypothetical protein
MFTLEIGGKPIAITDGAEEEARAVFESEAFRHDMHRWLEEGRPVWDGRAPMTLRPSTEEEIAQFKGPDAYPPHGAH